MISVCTRHPAPFSAPAAAFAQAVAPAAPAAELAAKVEAGARFTLNRGAYVNGRVTVGPRWFPVEMDDK